MRYLKIENYFINATGEDQSAGKEMEADSEAKQEPTDVWMDFDAIFKCFK